MKKILFVITKSNYGGAQRYVYDLATSLNGTYEVVVALGGDGLLKEKLIANGVRVIALPSLSRDISITKELKSFFDIYSIIKKERPSILHLNSSKASGIGALVGRLLGVPNIVFTAHAWAFNENRPWYEKKIIWFLSLITVLLSHVTICVSDAVRDALSLSFLKKKMVTVHLGIEEKSGLQRQDARAFFASHIPIDQHTKIIVTIAELHPIKGLAYAIEAISSIPDCAYVIIGEGEERHRLETLIKNKSLEKKVFLLGYLKDAGSYLSGADLFLLPSLSEALGYVLLEAGASRLPVIATSVGGIPEVIIDHKTGIVVPPANSMAIKEAILGISPEQEALFGSQLNKKIEEQFSLKKMKEKTISIYEQK